MDGIGAIILVGLFNLTTYAQCNFTVSATTACRGTSLMFQISGSYKNVNWSFGDGKFDSNAFTSSYSSHVYDTFGTFTATFSGYDASNEMYPKNHHSDL